MAIRSIKDGKVLVHVHRRVAASFPLLLFKLLPKRLYYFFHDGHVVLGVLFDFRRLGVPAHLSRTTLGELVGLPFTRFRRFFGVTCLRVRRTGG